MIFYCSPLISSIMALNIKQPHELATSDFLKALFYGGPGVGKSTLALSAPRPLNVDCDGGVKRVNEMHLKPTIEVGCWEDVTAILDGDISDYDSIVIDTVGKMLLFMNEYLGRKTPRYKKTDGALTQQGYGVRKEMFMDFINRVSRLKKHLFFVAHDKEDKKGELLFTRPDVGGSSGMDLIRELDLVGFLYIGGGVRILSCDPAEAYYGKNTCNLPRDMQLPNVSGISKNDFLTRVCRAFADSGAARAKMSLDFRNTIVDIEKHVDGIKDAPTANAVYQLLSSATYPHIWDSKEKGLRLCAAKAAELKLGVDSANKCFTPAPKPPKTAKQDDKGNGVGEPAKAIGGAETVNDVTHQDPVDDKV